MSLQEINLGEYPNDGTGDDLRTAFAKINDNFFQLDLNQGQDNTASNLGTGTGIFKEKLGVNLGLRSLTAGLGIDISLASGANEIIIANTSGSLSVITADTGSLTTTSAGETLNVIGGSNIDTSIVGHNLTITNTYTLQTETTPQLGGNLSTHSYNITGTGNVTATNFYGTFNGNLLGNTLGSHTGTVAGNVTGLVYGIDIRVLESELHSFDMGSMIPTLTSFIEWLKFTISLDLGTFLLPAAFTIDGGSF
jgi:hypothetical protein